MLPRAAGTLGEPHTDSLSRQERGERGGRTGRTPARGHDALPAPAGSRREPPTCVSSARHVEGAPAWSRCCGHGDSAGRPGTLRSSRNAGGTESWGTRASGRDPSRALCSDSTTALGTQAPGPRGACWSRAGEGLFLAGQRLPCLRASTGQAGPAHPHLPWGLFLIQDPMAALPPGLTCPGGRQADGPEPQSPRASLRPRLGAFTRREALTFPLAAGGVWQGRVHPAVSLQCPESPGPRWC